MKHRECDYCGKISGPRIMLYAHDGRGIGHVVRICVLARAARAYWQGSEVILVSGAPELVALCPAGAEAIKLPSYFTDDRGGGHFYTSSPTLSVHRDSLTAARCCMLLNTVSNLSPDILVTDFAPGGKRDELIPSLREFAKKTAPTLTVLCLRAVLDERSQSMRDTWCSESVALMRRYYDALVVLGRREIFDFDVAYGCADMNLPPIIYSQMLASPFSLSGAGTDGSGSVSRRRSNLLVSFGSGYRADATASLLATALNTLNSSILPDMITIVLGPKAVFDTGSYARLLNPEVNARTRLFAFVPNMQDLYSAASHFVGYAGNNTVSEVLASRIPSLLIARNQSEREQETLLDVLAPFTTILRFGEKHLVADDLSRGLHELLQQTDLRIDPRCVPDDGFAAINSIKHLWDSRCEGPHSVSMKGGEG